MVYLDCRTFAKVIVGLEICWLRGRSFGARAFPNDWCLLWDLCCIFFLFDLHVFFEENISNDSFSIDNIVKLMYLDINSNRAVKDITKYNKGFFGSSFQIRNRLRLLLIYIVGFSSTIAIGFVLSDPANLRFGLSTTIVIIVTNGILVIIMIFIHRGRNKVIQLWPNDPIWQNINKIQTNTEKK